MFPPSTTTAPPPGPSKVTLSVMVGRGEPIVIVPENEVMSIVFASGFAFASSIALRKVPIDPSSSVLVMR